MGFNEISNAYLKKNLKGYRLHQMLRNCPFFKKIQGRGTSSEQSNVAVS